MNPVVVETLEIDDNFTQVAKTRTLVKVSQLQRMLRLHVKEKGRERETQREGEVALKRNTKFVVSLTASEQLSAHVREQWL